MVRPLLRSALLVCFARHARICTPIVVRQIPTPDVGSIYRKQWGVHDFLHNSASYLKVIPWILAFVYIIITSKVNEHFDKQGDLFSLESIFKVHDLIFREMNEWYERIRCLWS